MPYCHHCGTKTEKNSKFCKRCGKKIGGPIEEEKFPEPKNDEDYIEIPEKKKGRKGIIIGGVIIIVIIAIFLFIIYKPNILGEVIGTNKEKEACPHECCPYGDYKEKQCSLDYECRNNECIAIDSDNDGLTDIEEKEIGTNSNLYDTDGDTWSDYKEYKEIGTNPLKKNSDEDRYDDNEDPEPLIKNTAQISIETSNQMWNWDYVNLGILVMTFGGSGALNPDMVIAEPSTNVIINNYGTDYSSYFNFNLVFKVSSEEVGRKSVSLTKIDVGESIIKTYQESIILRDVPDLLINLVKEGTSDWSISTENLEYEKY